MYTIDNGIDTDVMCSVSHGDKKLNITIRVDVSVIISKGNN